MHKECERAINWWQPPSSGVVFRTRSAFYMNEGVKVNSLLTFILSPYCTPCAPAPRGQALKSSRWNFGQFLRPVASTYTFRGAKLKRVSQIDSRLLLTWRNVWRINQTLFAITQGCSTLPQSSHSSSKCYWNSGSNSLVYKRVWKKKQRIIVKFIYKSLNIELKKFKQFEIKYYNQIFNLICTVQTRFSAIRLTEDVYGTNHCFRVFFIFLL